MREYVTMTDVSLIRDSISGAYTQTMPKRDQGQIRSLGALRAGLKLFRVKATALWIRSHEKVVSHS